MKHQIRKITFAIVFAISAPAFGAPGNQDAASAMLFRDPSQPIDRRVQDLLGRLTIEEKASLVKSDSPPIPRLGIEGWNWWSEALHGITAPNNHAPATCFPQALGMAASWDPELMRQVGDAVSDELRARYYHGHENGLSVFTPNINILRDPRWGRALETYGEDPYLTLRMGVAYIRGLQGDDPRYLKAAATAKHFAVHSGPETQRRHFNAVLSMQDLQETYLRAFHAAVQEGHVAAVMSSYNEVNGTPCTANHFLLDETLRTSWGFAGYVVSDDQAAADVCGSYHLAPTQKEGGALVMNNGCDMELGSAAFASLADAVKEGLVTQQRFDEACGRSLKVRFELGDFDPPAMVPYAKIPYSVVGGEKSLRTALQMARESLVLLKNQNQILPLDEKRIRSIAVIGPNADNPDTLISSYFWSTPTELVTPLQAIRQRLAGRTQVLYACGCNWQDSGSKAEVIPDSALLPPDDAAGGQGLEGKYYQGTELTGKPFAQRFDPRIDFNWSIGEPVKGLGHDRYSVRWEGRLVPPASGAYSFIIRADDGMRLYINGQKIAEDWSIHPPRDVQSKPVQLVAGKAVKITVEYFQNTEGAVAQLKWIPPVTMDPAEEAVKIAKDSDVAVLFLGLHNTSDMGGMEGEGVDRQGITLPINQEALLKKIQATGKPVILVLMNGGPLTCEWAQNNVPGIIEAWYPGQEGGTAIAETLFGDFNPGGRLPCTVYREEKDIPPFDNYSMEGRTYRYFKGTPLYPFGFGLTYTTFAYSNLTLDKSRISAGDVINVALNVKNTGARDGDDVVQVYVSKPGGVSFRPIRQLAGFWRVHIAAGQSKRVMIPVRVADWRYWDERAAQWRLEPGSYRIDAGASSVDSSLNATIQTTQRN